VLNNEKAQKAVEMLKIMKDYSSDELTGKSYDEITLDFINGGSAIFEGYPDFLFTNYEDLVSLNLVDLFDIKPLPKDEGGNFSQLNYMLVGVHASSLKKDKAWEWIKLYTSKEKSVSFLDNYGMLPVRASTYENEDLNNKYEFLKDIYDLLKNTEYRNVPKISASYYLWEDGLNRELTKGLEKESTPQEIINAIEKKWNDILLMKKPHKEFTGEEV
jgi:ABC-type glycerol-3-phosphate transport system substrate-binding protein